MASKASDKSSPRTGAISAQSTRPPTAQSTRPPTPFDEVPETPETLEPEISSGGSKEGNPASPDLGLEYDKQGAESLGPWITPDPRIPIEQMSLMEYLSSRTRMFPCYWKKTASDNDSNSFLSHIHVWKNLALEYLHEVDEQVEDDHPRHAQIQQVIQRLEDAYKDLFSSILPVRDGHDNTYIVSTLERVWQTRLKKLPPIPNDHKRYWLRDGYQYYVVDPKFHAGYIDVKCAWEMEPNDIKKLVQTVVFQERKFRLNRMMAVNAPESTLWYIHNNLDNRLWSVTAFDPATRSVSLHDKKGQVVKGIHSFK